MVCDVNSARKALQVVFLDVSELSQYRKRKENALRIWIKLLHHMRRKYINKTKATNKSLLEAGAFSAV